MEKYLPQQWQLFITAFTTLFAVFIFYPVYISSFNSTYFNLDFLLKITAGLALASFVFSLSAYLLKDRTKYLWIVSTALLLVIFIKGSIFPTDLAQLTGQDLMKSQGTTRHYTLLLLWFAAALAFTAKFGQKLKYLAVMILAFTCIYSGYIVIKHREQAVFSKLVSQGERADNLPPFSTEFNIIILGIDTLQGTVIEHAFMSDPGAFANYDGFTIFTRSFTSFPGTHYSVPLLLSGALYAANPDDAAGNHTQKNFTAASENSVFKDLLLQGMNTTMVGFGKFTPPADNPKAGRYVFMQSTSLDGNLYDMGIELYGQALYSSIGRIAGFWSERLIFAIQFCENRVKLKWVDLYRYLPQHIRAEAGAVPQALFTWDMTVHPPLGFKRGGAFERVNISSLTCADFPPIVEEALFGVDNLAIFLNKFKEAGVYDNSLIMIVSDHGAHFPPVTSCPLFFESLEGFQHGYESGVSSMGPADLNNVLFIKPPKAKGKPVITHDPVWLGDTKPIIEFYNEHREYTPSRDVVRQVRAFNPEPQVMKWPWSFKDSGALISAGPHNHQFVQTSSLEVLPGIYKSLFEELSEWQPIKIDEVFSPSYEHKSYDGFFTMDGKTLIFRDRTGAINLQLKSGASEESNYKLKQEFVASLKPHDSGPESDGSIYTLNIWANGLSLAEKIDVTATPTTVELTIPAGLIKEDGKIQLTYEQSPSSHPSVHKSRLVMGTPVISALK